VGKAVGSFDGLSTEVVLMKRCGDCNARYGTAHATNCPKYLESLYKRIAELEADKQRLWDSIEAGESVYKRKCDRLEAQNNRLKTICDCRRLVAALEDTQ